jgi:hypothetical protein
MDFMSHPTTVAVVGALTAAVLGAIGYLARRWLDRSDLVVYTEDVKQVLPLLGEQPQLERDTVYCESVRFHLLVAHNLKGKRPVRVKRVEFEARPVNIPGEELEALDYRIDASALQGHGIVALREYAFRLSGSKIVGQYFESREQSLEVDPSNVFRSTKETVAFDIEPQREFSLQPVFAIDAASPGLYQSRVRVHYDVGGKPRERTTQWIYVFMK